MQIDLNEKEAGLLRKLVECELEEINPEIRHSATSGKRDELREVRRLLRGLLGRIPHSEERRGVVNA